MSSSSSAIVINERYEVVSRVGRGGMADVFLANDQLLERQVAIKVLFPEFAVDPNFVERFRREAQSAASLSHPNIVNVYDWGKYDTTYFIAMEYVKGRTLADILKTNDRLPPKQSAEIASEVAAALGFAHDGGVAHRDIKPANILIGANGQVKVADFGIARAMNSAAENALTQAGSVMGTAAYFSPEQAQGAQPDPRSDLYSLGIVMYEMVAGKPPFQGENAVAIAYKQVHDQPRPLNQIIEGVPLAFEAIVAKLLAKDPKLRYPNAGELRDDLRRFRTGEPVQALAAAAPREPTGGTPPSGATRTVAIDATPVGMTRAMPNGRGAETTLNPAPTTVARANVDRLPPGSSPEARYYQDNNQRTGWYALAAFIAMILLGIGGYLLYDNIANGSDSGAGLVLPDYYGWTLDDTVQDLQSRDLRASPQPTPDPTLAEDIVIRTEPAANEVVPKNSTVTIFFNPKSNLIVVPNVEGLPYDEAVTKLNSVGFQVAETPVTEESDTVQEGHVIRTNPEAEAPVPPTTVITIIVSGGNGRVAIPNNIIGQTYEDAADRLAEVGLDATKELRYDPSIPENIVIESTPATGEYVAQGSVVTLIVSNGPGEVSLPSLIGLSESEARAQLQRLNLSAQVSYTDLPAGDRRDGKVVEQNKPAGTSVGVGSTIELVVGVAVETTTTAVVTLAPATTTTSPPVTTTATTTTTSTTTTTTTTTTTVAP